MDDQLLERLRGASHVAILTGAGVSAESGLPTFRDALTGLWANHRPEDLATPEAFERNPGMVWDWYRMRREGALKAEPNAAHLALARLEELVPRVTLITQNVDGLHRRAGSRTVIELHGDITRVRCSLEGVDTEVWDEPRAGGEPPRLQRLRLVSQACRRVVRRGAAGEGAPPGLGRSLRVRPLPRGGHLEPGGAGRVAALARGGAGRGSGGGQHHDGGPTVGAGIHHLTGPAGVVLPELLQAAWPSAGRGEGG